jgi:putative transcriptional regulator
MIDDILHYKTNVTLGSGKLLISEPMLLDENFQRTVIYMCHHDANESVGYVLNRLASHTLSHYIDSLHGIDFPLHIGGPVDLHTLHFIHTMPDIQGTHIGDNIYWSGDLEQAFEYIKLGKITEQNCKFFLGYSGWGKGQLDAEMDMKSWIVANANADLIFNTQEELLWKSTIESLGPKYKNLLFVPQDPTMN